jgi:hypothetical protein
MSNVVPFNTDNLPNLGENFARNLEQASAQLRTTTGLPILRLLKSGEWVYGQNFSEVEDGSEWAIHPGTLEWGWISWKDAKPQGEKMVAMGYAPMPTLEELGSPPGDQWMEQRSVQMQCVSGSDEGANVVYKGTSAGLLNAFTELVKMIAPRLTAGEPCVPIVTLGVGHYMHKNREYGKIYTPEIKVLRWVTLESPHAAETTEVEEAPRKKRGRKRGRNA